MDSWVRHQVSLEFSQVNIESTVESEGSSDGGHNLTNKPVEIGVGWSFDIQVSAANIVNSFVINHEGTVGVLKGGVSGQDGVVGFNYSSGNLGSRVNGEFQFGFLNSNLDFLP